MVWRKSSALSDFLGEISDLFSAIDPGLLKP
jgi:hypothetical protein